MHAGPPRPVDELRAQDVIARTFQEEGVNPELNRPVKLSADQTVKLEAAAAGHKFGVAYLTREEAKDLGALLPRHDRKSDALVVVPGIGDDADAHVLVLWNTDYMQDDLSGEAHSETSIAAERKIARDVRDFLVEAQHEGWP